MRIQKKNNGIKSEKKNAFTCVFVDGILTKKKNFYRVHRTLDHTRKFGLGRCSLLVYSLRDE